MSAERNFTEQDYELLSAYLDGALASAERAALETRLQADDGLRQELEALRQTVNLVGSVPAMKAPRNFTLTPGMVSLRRNRWLIFPTSAAFSGLTAAAATILILIGAGLFLLQNNAMNSFAPSAMQSTGLEQQGQTQFAMIPTQTTLTSEKTAEQEMADQVTVTAPPLEDLSVTQVILTAETLSDGTLGEAGDAFATAPDTITIPEQSPAAASEISAYNIAPATLDEETTQTLQSAAPMGATLNPEATMLPPAQPPAAGDSAAQVGGNSEPDTGAQTGAAAGLADLAQATVTETADATFQREGQIPLTASAPASPAIIAAAGTPTPAPTATVTATPSPTLTQTPGATQAPPSDDRVSDADASNPTDFAPLIVLAGFVLLIVAIGTTIMRRRG